MGRVPRVVAFLGVLHVVCREEEYVNIGVTRDELRGRYEGSYLGVDRFVVEGGEAVSMAFPLAPVRQPLLPSYPSV